MRLIIFLILCIGCGTISTTHEATGGDDADMWTGPGTGGTTTVMDVGGAGGTSDGQGGSGDFDGNVPQSMGGATSSDAGAGSGGTADIGGAGQSSMGNGGGTGVECPAVVSFSRCDTKPQCGYGCRVNGVLYAGCSTGSVTFCARNSGVSPSRNDCLNDTGCR